MVPHINNIFLALVSSVSLVIMLNFLVFMYPAAAIRMQGEDVFFGYPDEGLSIADYRIWEEVLDGSESEYSSELSDDDDIDYSADPFDYTRWVCSDIFPPEFADNDNITGKIVSVENEFTTILADDGQYFITKNVTYGVGSNVTFRLDEDLEVVDVEISNQRQQDNYQYGALVEWDGCHGKIRREGGQDLVDVARIDFRYIPNVSPHMKVRFRTVPYKIFEERAVDVAIIQDDCAEPNEDAQTWNEEEEEQPECKMGRIFEWRDGIKGIIISEDSSEKIAVSKSNLCGDEARDLLSHFKWKQVRKLLIGRKVRYYSECRRGRLQTSSSTGVLRVEILPGENGSFLFEKKQPHYQEPRIVHFRAACRQLHFLQNLPLRGEGIIIGRSDGFEIQYVSPAGEKLIFLCPEDKLCGDEFHRIREQYGWKIVKFLIRQKVFWHFDGVGRLRVKVLPPDQISIPPPKPCNVAAAFVPSGVPTGPNNSLNIAAKEFVPSFQVQAEESQKPTSLNLNAKAFVPACTKTHLKSPAEEQEPTPKLTEETV